MSSSRYLIIQQENVRPKVICIFLILFILYFFPVVSVNVRLLPNLARRERRIMWRSGTHGFIPRSIILYLRTKIILWSCFYATIWPTEFKSLLPPILTRRSINYYIMQFIINYIPDIYFWSNFQTHVYGFSKTRGQNSVS